jgi:PilZ domain
LLQIRVAADYFSFSALVRALGFLHPTPSERFTMSVERRRSSRIPFAASAEIIDEAENTRSTSQVSDLSLHGCFVQLPNPFPEGTPVTIEIYKDEDFVETPATVAYFMPKRGMGLTFTGTEPQFAAILKKWISQSKATARPA